MTDGELRAAILALGADDVGCFYDSGAAMPFPFGISLVVRLSDAVISEIGEEPTHTYFHHYRTVNAYIDRLTFEAGRLLQGMGNKYLPVAASQSVNVAGQSFSGRYSHKKGACLSGLGFIGKSGLFIHNEWGPAVRLGTIFTDRVCDGPGAKMVESRCDSCNICVSACPAMALTGKEWSGGEPGRKIVDARACSEYMKNHFHHIGRGAVCGICIKICTLWHKKV